MLLDRVPAQGFDALVDHQADWRGRSCVRGPPLAVHRAWPGERAEASVGPFRRRYALLGIFNPFAFCSSTAWAWLATFPEIEGQGFAFAGGPNFSRYVVKQTEEGSMLGRTEGGGKTMRRLLSATGVLALAAIGLTMAWAGAFKVKPLTLVSGPSPFAPGCEITPQTGTNFVNAEVEPRAAVNPTNPKHIVGVWQQDRWSNGGARGLLTGVSFNGGMSWTNTFAPLSRCAGGNPGIGADFERASDPWVTFDGNGGVHQISISFNDSNTTNAVLVSRSTDGGLTWSNPITLILDTAPTVFNDKESITADPGNANLVFAVWDRLVFPSAQASASAAEHAIGFRGPTFFSRSMTGGVSWEPARMIFDPGEVDQTIGNQIVVLPNGDLVDGFNLIFNFKNAGGVRGFNVALIRSTDKGVTWSGPTIVDKLLTRALFDPQQTGVRDPDTGDRVRTGDIIPDIAVDRNPGSPGFGNLYFVWQDSRFSNFAHDSIAFSRSTDGGFTWSPPIQINKTPTNIPSGNQQAFTATVRVAADGTIGVTYYDFRNNTPDPTTLPTDYFIVHCHPSPTVSCTDPADWRNEARITPVSFDMRTAPFARGFFVGDYEGLTTVGTDFKPFFVQTNSGNAANRTDVFATTASPIGP